MHAWKAMDYWTEQDEIVICGNLSEHCSEDSYSRVKFDQTHVVLLGPLLVDGFSFVSLRQIDMYIISISVFQL
jgi:hypothetical protein